MFKNLIKSAVIISFVAVALIVSSWLATKYALTVRAEKKAQNIISAAYDQASPKTEDDKIKAITTHIFENFEQQDPTFIFQYKFRPYITNKRLPDFLRLESGVLETLVEKGLCDNAARLLSFTLKQEGFDSIQWDMVTPVGGHAALLVTLPDDRKAYIDPIFGIAAENKDGKLIHPNEAYALIKSGSNIKDVFHPLSVKSDYKFYTNFADVSMGAENEPLIIEAVIPASQPTIKLGDINNNSQDVQSESTKYAMGTVWNYVGHKYNRNWVRVLKALKPVRIVMTLTSDVTEGVITSEPSPEINGNQMTWNLQAGENLKLYDERAKISLRRLNSYIDVDQIAFYQP